MSAMIAPEVATVAIAARCRLLELPRATYYRAQAEAAEADIELHE